MKRLIPIVGALLALFLFVQPAAAAGWTILGHHTVRPSETLYCIARAYGVDPGAIATQNGLVNPNLIYNGMVLAIPNAPATLPAGRICTAQFGGTPPITDCTCAHYHTIVAGDNLYRISLTYGTSMWRIAECNGIYNLNLIYPGHTLCIPD